MDLKIIQVVISAYLWICTISTILSITMSKKDEFWEFQFDKNFRQPRILLDPDRRIYQLLLWSVVPIQNIIYMLQMIYATYNWYNIK